MALEKASLESGAGKGKRRTVDKWKKKQWYTIVAPKEFDERILGESVSTKPEHLMGRVVKASVRDLAGQIKKQHITLLFKVNDVKGNKAHTEAVGHTVNDSYMRRIVRRRSSKVDVVRDIMLLGGKKLHIKVVAVTNRRARKAQETEIRHLMEAQLDTLSGKKDANNTISDLVFGNITNKINSEIKKIHSIKRIEVLKSQVI
jgi:small subunit ribosomal protein S3Ae